MKPFLFRYYYAFILMALFLCASKYTGAQEKQVFSLAELIDSAQKNLPLLLQKKALINSAKANVTATKNAFLPKLTIGDELSIGSSNDVAGSYLPINGIIRTISGSIREQSNYKAQTGNLASVYAEYELINFGLRGSKIDNALAYVNLQQADFGKEVYLLKHQIGQLYFNMIKGLYQLHVDQENINRYKAINDIIAALTTSGIKPGVDSSLAKAELSKIKVSYNQHEGMIKQLQQQLSFLTGIPDTQLQVDTLSNRKDISNFAETETDTLNNPLLAYSLKQRDLYISTERLVRKSYLPKIILAGGGWGRGSSIHFNDQYGALGSGLGFQRFNYVGAIGISYDLFNTVHRKNQAAVSHYQTQAATHEFQQQKLALRNANKQAEQAIITAEQNLNELPTQLQAAHDVYNQKVAQYKAGVINLIDLTNASFVLYSAQLDYVETLNDWYLANLDKASSTGNLDVFIQTLTN